jgi:hypothetical protein
MLFCSIDLSVKSNAYTVAVVIINIIIALYILLCDDTNPFHFFCTFCDYFYLLIFYKNLKLVYVVLFPILFIPC